MLGLKSRIRIPIPRNPYNATAYVLGVANYSGWSDHWFKVAKLSGPLKVLKVEPSLPSFSSSGSCSIQLSWTYDPHIYIPSM